MSKRERENIIREIKKELDAIQEQANAHGDDTTVKNTILNINSKIINTLENATDKGLNEAHKQLKSIAKTNFNISHFDAQYPAIISYTRLLIAFTILTDSNFGDTKSKIRGLKTDVAIFERELEELQGKAIKFKDLKLDDISEHAEKIEEFYDSFFETVDEEKQKTQFNIINEIASITKAINTQIKTLDEKHQKPFHGDNGILNDIQTKYNDITSKEPEITTQITAINSIYNDIVSKQIDEESEEKSYTKPSKKETLDSFFKTIKDLEKTINTQKSEYEKLNSKTQELNTALEKAKNDYTAQKEQYEELEKKVNERYADISKGDLIKQHDKNSRIFKAEYKQAMYLQIIVLCVIFLVYSVLMYFLPDIIQKFKTIEHEIMFSIFVLVSSYIPYKMIASLHENKILAKKLAEEYNHKHSFINSVVGFNTTYKDDKESQKNLVDKMIIALERNPSDEISHILNQNSKTPHDKFIEKICDIGEGVVSIPKKIQRVFTEDNKRTKRKKEISKNTDDNSQKEPEETQ